MSLPACPAVPIHGWASQRGTPHFATDRALDHFSHCCFDGRASRCASQMRLAVQRGASLLRKLPYVFTSADAPALRTTHTRRTQGIGKTSDGRLGAVVIRAPLDAAVGGTRGGLAAIGLARLAVVRARSTRGGLATVRGKVAAEKGKPTAGRLGTTGRADTTRRLSMSSRGREPASANQRRGHQACLPHIVSSLKSLAL